MSHVAIYFNVSEQARKMLSILLISAETLDHDKVAALPCSALINQFPKGFEDILSSTRELSRAVINVECDKQREWFFVLQDVRAQTPDSDVVYSFSKRFLAFYAGNKAAIEQALVI